jgi:uncharacterized membrane protein
MFQKSRLDALSDGIFGVAMTLLILDVRLPDDFYPKDGAELVQGLLGVWPRFLWLSYLLLITCVPFSTAGRAAALNRHCKFAD